MDKEENIDGSPASTRSPPAQAEDQVEVKIYVERRVRLNDTYIKKLRAKDENIFKRPLLINL